MPKDGIFCLSTATKRVGNAHTPTVIFFMTQPFEKDTNFINKRTQNIFVVIKSNCQKDSRITGVKSV